MTDYHCGNPALCRAAARTGEATEPERPARPGWTGGPARDTDPAPPAIARDTDQWLLHALADLGAIYGPLGVALAAAVLSDPAVVIARLTANAEPPDTSVDAVDRACVQRFA